MMAWVVLLRRAGGDEAKADGDGVLVRGGQDDLTER
jgi:hypothetical protein